MALRRQLVCVLAGVFASLGASYRTTNFVIDAPTPAIAQQVGELAERYRREKAIDWLGQEMPTWPEPCPVKVKVQMSGAGGATSFAFDRGRVLGQHMTIEGSLDRLLNSVLPHEVTHTVFAYHFKRPVPRWADEGGSVLSEDEPERQRHDQLVRQILNQGRGIPLKRLFALTEYPSDVMCLYAQGYSVSNYLVSLSSRPEFLNFVAHGMWNGWDNAVQTFYRYRNVDDLEQAWLAHLRSTRRQPPALLAHNQQPARTDPQQPRTIVRLTAPPAQPLDAPAPVYRGQSPEEAEPPRRTVPGQTTSQAESAGAWKPVAEPTPGQPSVRLGRPQVLPPPQSVPPERPPVSPVGYPN